MKTQKNIIERYQKCRAIIFIVIGACGIEPRVQQVAHTTEFRTAKIMRRVCKIFLHTRLIILL